MSSMLRSNWWKLVGAVLLGAIGSGVWETVVRPLLNLVSNCLLTISTLGLKVLADDIYIEIARGLHEDASIQLLVTAILLLPYVFIRKSDVIDPTIAKYRELITRQNEANRHSSAPDSRILPPLPVPSDQVSRRNPRAYSAAAFIMTSVFMTLIGVRFLYVNRAIVHFRQSLDIAAPFMSDVEEERARAEFSAIRTKNGYVRVVSQLRAVIVANGKAPPAFTLW